MAECPQPQSDIFSKIIEDLEKFCEGNNKIKESVKIVDVNKEESVDNGYETLQNSLVNSEKVLSEIVDYVKKSREQWLAQKKNKQQEDLLNGFVETNEVVEEKEETPKVGLLKLVSLDKLLDPSRLNGKIDNDSVIVLSDAESEVKTPRKRSTVLCKNEKPLNKTRMSANKARPLRAQAKKSYKAVKTVEESGSSSSEEETTVKYNRIKRSRRKMSDSSASDPGFVVSKKAKKPEKKTAVKKMSGSESDGKWKVDGKVNWKAYVPLPRVQCEKLKEHYLKKTKIAQQREKITLSSILNENSEEAMELNLTDLVKNKTVQSEKTEKLASGAITDHTNEESDGSATPDDLEDKKSANTEEKKDGSVDDQNKNVEVNPRDEPEAPSITEVASDMEKSSGPPEKNEDNCSRNQSDENAEKEKTDSTTLSDPGVENKSNDDNSRNQSDESVEKQKRDSKQINDKNKSKKDCPRKQLDESAEEKEIDSNKSEESPEEEKKKSVEKTTLKKRPNFESDEDDDKKKHSSDSEDFDFAKFNTKKEKEKRSKQKKKKVLSSDSENESSDKGKAEESESVSSEKSEEESQEKTDKTRRRIKRLKDSSSEAEDGSDTEKSPEKSTRKQLKKIIEKSNLSESTKQAEKEERERKARILEKQKKYNQIFDAELLKKSTVDKIVLDFDEDTKSELLTVHKQLVKHLKPHQAAGIKFMWDACFESLERARKIGSGCILAHCMGLGKTLQVVALCHTLLTNSNKTGVEKVMVVCPLNTVLNWVDEFKKWLPKSSNFEVFEIVSHKQNSGRQFIVNEWFNDGGVLIIGYDMFRNLANENNKRLSKKMRADFHRGLIDPGPDVVVCDEGHLLKNEKTSLSIAMNRLKTLRRIVLTGTPLQNNLKEYYCMVQFVKPNLLGTYKEYLNRFVNPITNGQYTDSTPMDIHIMRRRSHVLHKLLDGVVQRRDYCVLAPYLPPKHEYVLFLSLTQKQIELYRHYMNNRAKNQDVAVTKGKASFLFADFQEFQRICTHPKVLQDKSLVDREKEKNYDSEEEDSEGSIKDFIDDDEDDAKSSSSESSSSSSKSDVSISSNKKKKQKTRVTRAAAAAAGGIDEIIRNHEEETKPVEWWEQFLSEEDLENINFSSKLFLLFEILAQCEAIGDKILVFSQSLYSLNVIEYFLHKIDDATQNGKTCCGFSGSWSLGLDYFRIDGSSSCDNRAAWCRSFNDPENIRARLFLISTRAGGLGINLVAANRVIIFDVSWNPSHDTQSIYRVYRFGQTKPCYIYRFVTLGTMEMKIYERQVTKQAISKRVIDEQQIDRHYNQNDLMELYKFEPVPEGERPTPLVPKDVLLGELLQHFADRIYKYHEHQTLLENKEDEVLDEDERKAAWEEFENEKNTRAFTTGYWMGIPMERATNAIRRILLRELPQMDAQQLNVMIFTRMKQIEAEVKQANNENYSKVIAEINRIQVEQEQKFREHCMQQQAMKMMQQQFALTGRPEYFNALQHLQNQQLANFAGRAGVYAYNTQQPSQNVSNEIIDLNE